ncbi:hypothetical protein BOTBODRAFT_134995 [Botryobasidium botryosum FD-172 SS1]|uniref:intramembrane prenyl-peptidase Rce1 n=1 Tax=Botryobasidium botryosum (strain FD-172 SS1) TaxID=930990 RepID=A0A067MJP8_BOTB1|nr:hypothetical protein BOTBODRAFT_134995 [Botryobasidium botryosum FD-172 SS1]
MTAAIASSTSVLLQASFTFAYISCLYFTRTSRISTKETSQDGRTEIEHLGRNHPSVIKARLRAAVISTCLCCFVVMALLWQINSREASLKRALTVLGLLPSNLSLRTILPHLIAPLLYTGPLYSHFLSSYLPFQRNWSFQRDVKELIGSWQGLRNFIVAPITEEIVFRSCIVSVALHADISFTRIVFLTPLWFGAAHIHHAYETYITGGRTSLALKRAIIMSGAQLTYTTLFGWYTTYLFLRTRSIYPPITAHIFCNVMGIPTPASDVHVHPTKKAAIWGTHILGIIGFVAALKPWTASSST